MRVVEVSGRTVDDAVARALAQLGVSRDHVDVDVIREGKRGLLGFGGEDAIVRVTAKETAVQAGGRPARGGRGGRRGGGGRGRGDGGGGRGGRSEERQERPPEDVDEDLDEEDEGPTRAEAERSERGRQGGRRGQRGGRSRRGGEGRRRGGGGYREERGPAVAPEDEVVVPGTPDELPSQPAEDAEDEIEFAGRTLRDLLTLLGLTETDIEAREPETPGDGVGRVGQVFDVSGRDEDASDELGLLIGRRGETLSALQYLLNVLARQRYEDEQHVLGVDIEGYRRRREQSLVEMAQRVAAEVRETGDVITLEPMRPAERRIIHMALSEEPGVTTESVGEGDDRQVEVLPL